MPEPNAVGRSDRAGLSPGARQLLARASEEQVGGRQPALNGWLMALLQRNGPLVEAMVPGIDITAMLTDLRTAIAAGTFGPPLAEDDLVARAAEHAALRERRAATEIDLAAVLLTAAGQTVPPPAELGMLPRRSTEAAGTSAASTTAPAARARPGEPIAWQPRATQPTPTLDRFGRDLTRQAADGQLGALVGRERELDLIVETLCRRHKRNPVLLGAAGTGKTAIVEGLARRMVSGRVPAALRGVRIVQLQPSSLVAGAGIVGELETRMRSILEEARQDGIVLFIDEVHAIVGTGGMRGTGDLASLIKPALARGDLACIAATTDEEYRRFIEDDAALERRFNPVAIDELDAVATVAVLRSHRDELQRLRGISVPDELLDWMIRFAAEAMPNRRFPDKAVDLLEQCVAHAVAQGHTAIDRAAAEGVVRRMVGVPVSVTERLAAFERDLGAHALSHPAVTRALLDRLAVTMRGLDSRRHGPNAIVLLSGRAAARAGEFAETAASALFGGPSRVVTVDLGRMTSAHDVAMLVGAPPGYIGYSDRLPIHRIASMPWSVVLCQGVDVAHPEIREVLAEALESGVFVDGSGRRIHLSDTIVVLACGALDATRRLGFRVGDDEAGTPGPAPSAAPERGATRGAARVLGDRLAALVDVEIDEHRAPQDAHDAVARVLARVTQRFAQEGIVLALDPSVGKWLMERAGGSGDLDRAADRELLPRLAPLIGEPAGEARTVRVAAGPDGLRVLSQRVAVAPAGDATEK